MSHGYGMDAGSPYSGYSSQDGDQSQMGSSLPGDHLLNVGVPAAPMPEISTVPLKKTCEVCSREKIKCDGKLPICSRCDRLKKPCHYTINKSKQLKVHKIALANMSPEDIVATYGVGTASPAPPTRNERGRLPYQPSSNGGTPAPTPPPAPVKRGNSPDNDGYDYYEPQQQQQHQPPPQQYQEPRRPPAKKVKEATVQPKTARRKSLVSNDMEPYFSALSGDYSVDQKVLSTFYPSEPRYAGPYQAAAPPNPSNSKSNQYGPITTPSLPFRQMPPLQIHNAQSNYSPDMGQGAITEFDSHGLWPRQVNDGTSTTDVLFSSLNVTTTGLVPEPPRNPNKRSRTSSIGNKVFPAESGYRTVGPHDSRASNEDLIVNMITFEGFRSMDEFVEVVRMCFRSILPFVPFLHRVYYTDMLSDDPTWQTFVAQTELVPLFSEFSQQGADRQTVQNFHLHAKNVLYTVINSLSIPPSQLPVNALRDLLLLLLCIIPSMSMTLESPVTYSLFMLTLSMARSLGMNEEPESGWGLDSERGVECPWTKGEKETSTRIWWSLYTLDKQIAAIWEHLPLISDAECRLRLPIGEGFLHDDQDFSPTSQKPHYIADAMANLEVKFQRTAPRSAWFSLIGLQGILGSITIYRAECVASRTEPYIPNPVLEQIQKRLHTWYDGLDPSVRLMDKEGVILGPAAAAFDRSHADGPRSVVLLLHTLLIFHAAGCLLHAPTGNIVSTGWERSPSFHLCMESAIRSGRVLKMMLVAGEESKLTTPFHVFAVHMTGLMHVIWLLALKKRLSGHWKLNVVGNVVTVIADEDAAATERMVPISAVLSSVKDSPKRLPTPTLCVTEAAPANPLKGMDPAMASAFLGADDDDDPSHILFSNNNNSHRGDDVGFSGSGHLGVDRPMSPMLSPMGVSTNHQRDLEDLLGVSPGDTGAPEDDIGGGSSTDESLEKERILNGHAGGSNLRIPTPIAGGRDARHISAMRSPSMGLPNSMLMSDSNGNGIASGSLDTTDGGFEYVPTFLAATIQHHQHLRADLTKPLTANEIQRMTWSDFFRVLKSLQFHLQTLSVLGTRARVRPLALRSKNVLIRLLEETDKPGPANHFSTVLLADCGLDSVGVA